MQPRIHALIPAAGQSLRFGGATAKQYVAVLGKPVLAHSIDALIHHPFICAVTVALSKDDGIYDELIRPGYPQVNTITGGADRAQSVLNGLNYISISDPACDWVLVHDAARPCLGETHLQLLIEKACSHEHGAILATPVTDTLKREADLNQIEKTCDRQGLWMAQTPQLFPIKTLLNALKTAIESGKPPTDEAEAMERVGFKPTLVSGSTNNIKITTSDDLVMVEFILKIMRNPGDQV